MRSSVTLLPVLLLGCGPTLAPGQAAPFPPADPELVAANVAVGDPYEGRFPFEEAVAGLPASGALEAILVTDEGEVLCRLEPEHAPLTVANFVGLARGLRPFRGPEGDWVRVPYYDDLPFHRAQEGQFVQTGRRGKLADGGFFLQDEISVGDSFDRPGVLAMANNGTPDSGSVQFFVTTGAAPQLEGEHTILGSCDGEAVLRRLERRVARGEQPRLRTVEIRRAPP